MCHALHALSKGLSPQVSPHPAVSRKHCFSQLLTERGERDSPAPPAPISPHSQPCPGFAGAARAPVPSLWPLCLGGCSVQCPGGVLGRGQAHSLGTAWVLSPVLLGVWGGKGCRAWGSRVGAAGSQACQAGCVACGDACLGSRSIFQTL